MTDAINVEITTEQPVVAANLAELRYLVFHGMIGDTGQSAYELAVELGFEGSEEDWIASLKGERGETLGWDVTDDGEGNVEMTYPDGVINSQKSVLYTEQTLTTAQKAQARENIGAAAASAVDGLTDTVEELDADVLALESISENQESAENVLSYPRSAATTVTGVTLSYNEETGLFTLNGINTGASNAIIGASAGTIQDGTALKPPAGVYRLELRCEQGMNPDVFWGVFYIGSQARYVLTDATGDTVEVYLDGNTMASAGVVVAPGKTADNLTLSFALRRVGTPEIGKLLVDQINHTQALQRKVLSMLDTLKSATQAISILDNFVLLNAPNASDLNAIGRNTYLTIARYNSSTLNSPYKQSSSLCGGHDCGLVFAYQAAAASGGSLGVQVGLVAGNVTSDGVSSGRALIRSVSGTTWTDWRVL